MLTLSELCQTFHSFATDTFTMDHSQSARPQRVTRSKERLRCTPPPPPSFKLQQQQKRPTRVFRHVVVCTKVYTPEARFDLSSLSDLTSCIFLGNGFLPCQVPRTVSRDMICTPEEIQSRKGNNGGRLYD